MSTLTAKELKLLHGNLWLAETDDLAIAMKVPEARAASYHMEQAVEKLLKSVLVKNGDYWVSSHALSDEWARLPDSEPFKEKLKPLLHYQRYATAGRYATSSGNLIAVESPEDIKRDAELVIKLIAEFRRDVFPDEPEYKRAPPTQPARHR